MNILLEVSACVFKTWTGCFISVPFMLLFIALRQCSQWMSGSPDQCSLSVRKLRKDKLSFHCWHAVRDNETPHFHMLIMAWEGIMSVWVCQFSQAYMGDYSMEMVAVCGRGQARMIGWVVQEYTWSREGSPVEVTTTVRVDLSSSDWCDTLNSHDHSPPLHLKICLVSRLYLDMIYPDYIYTWN